jgi:hypothetical protein
MPHKTADQDFGLLQAVDERLAMYGWLTNTGVKFVIVVDMEGRPATALDSKTTTAVGLRDADMKPVSLTLGVALVFLILRPTPCTSLPLLTMSRHSERCRQRTSNF